MRPRVAVVGSLNIDYLAAVERLPGRGETVAAYELVRRFGGKGANQAVAAARQGARVSMIGCLGSDDNGRAYRQRLRMEGIDASGICSTGRSLTGTALIAVERSGENLIVVAPGANSALSVSAVRTRQKKIASAQAVLVQWEIPLNAVQEAIRVANRARVTVVMNPSPWRDGFPWVRGCIDVLIANSAEAEAVCGLAPHRIAAHLAKWRRALARKNIDTLVITRGAEPTIYLSATNFGQVGTLKVTPRDTVGAGDTFAGVFATRFAEGVGLVNAIRYANCAAALATLRMGAQEAIPTRAATQVAVANNV